MTNAAKEDRMIVQITIGELRAVVRDEVERVAGTLSRTVARWIDVSAAAEHFGCTSQTIRNWIKLGAPARQIGATSHPQYRLDLAEFEAWVRDQGK